MSNVIRSLIVKVGADTADFSNKMKNVSKDLKKTGDSIFKVGSTLTKGVTMPIVGASVVAFKYAADIQDAMGASDQIFKTSSKNVKSWADNLASYYGMSEGEALSYANTMGAMLQNIGGLSEEEAAKESQRLVQLSGDLAAMFGGTTESAVQAITGALKGNNSMLDNYGMGVNEATIKTKALEMGLISEGEQLTLAQKQQATLALITEQTADAQGQAAREADGASGSLRALTTELKNIAGELGEVLLPIITPMITKFKELVQKFKELSPATKEMIVKGALLAATFGPVLMVVGGFITKLGSAFGAISKFSKAMKGGSTIIKGLGVLMGPGGLVIVGLAAFVAAAVLIWKNWDKITAAVKKAIDKVKTFFGIKDKDPGEAVVLTKGYGKYTQYAKGTNYVPNDGLAYLHKGEAVVPAKYNGGDTTTTINHTGTIRVEGVNSKGEFMGVVELLGKQISQDSRRLPNRASVIPI